MIKIAVGVVLVLLVAEVTCQRFIQPTYRPPRKMNPVIRVARDVSEPQWLYQGDIPRAPATGDHPVLPKYIDDVRLDTNRRYTRSLDSPSAKRGGGSPGASRGSGSRNTGPTHPGYNRRNTREVYPPFPKPLTFPRPGFPSPGPTFPRPGFPRPHFPIYARNTRDVNFGKKPSHRDVIIPNWNPNVKTNPWNRLGGKRRTRSTEISEEEQ